LIGRDDGERWLAEPPDGLCWGMLGVAGFDFLIKELADLDRLPVLFERGVRVFQPAETGSSSLGGSSDPGDDRGLTELGRAFLARLGELGGDDDRTPRPIVDLAGLNPRSMAEVIKVASGGSLADRVLLMYSHGALLHEGFATPRALSHENLAALRACGGVIGLTPGLPFHRAPAELRAGFEAASAAPFMGREGFEGIAVGSDFLDVEQTMPPLRNVAHLKKWIKRRFDRATADLLIAANGRRLLLRAVCGEAALDRNGE
jgi:membrane dipeptidase